jgi:hypothetical protein
MSNFSDFVSQPISQKILIFEIDTTESIPFWLIEEAGIWKYKLTNGAVDVALSFQNGSFCYGNFQGGGIATTGTNFIIKNCASFAVDGIDYTSCASLADLRLQESGFYFEPGTTNLYVQFFQAKRPDNFALIEMGLVSGFSNQDTYLNNIFYQGKIKSAPQISIEKDRLFFGLLRYSGGSCTLDNTDGYFDGFINQALFGQTCRFKFGGNALAYADYRTMYEGYIESVTANQSDFSVTIGDKKKQIDRTLPIRFFDTTTYPAISDGNADKPIPLAYGQVYNMPIVCTDEKGAGGGSFHFKIVDVADHIAGIKSIDAVYVDGTARVPATTDLVNATFTFTVASGFYTAGKKVTCDFKGFQSGGNLIDNSLDILKDIFSTYLSIPYSASNYDLTNWAESTLSAKDIGFAITDNTDVSEIIEKICTSNYGNLIINNNGLFTFKFSNTAQNVSIVIDKDEIFDDVQRDDNGTEYLTSATVLYRKDYGEDKESSFTDNTQQATIYNEYKTYRTQEFKSYLTNRSDAIILADTIMDNFNTIKPVLTRSVSMRASELELLDTYAINMDRLNKIWLGNVKCELIGISYDFDNWKIKLTGVYISDYDVNDYAIAGTWMTSGALAFPAELGGGAITAWNKLWTNEQKVWARDNIGWWCGDDGLIDPVDADSRGTEWDV